MGGSKGTKGQQENKKNGKNNEKIKGTKETIMGGTKVTKKSIKK